jgi:hypothetical protein
LHVLLNAIALIKSITITGPFTAGFMVIPFRADKSFRRGVHQIYNLFHRILSAAEIQIMEVITEISHW